MGDSLRMQSIVLGGLFLAVVIVGLVLGSFYRGTARTTTFLIPFDILECDEDDDCGLANQVSCCPCEAGGGQGAVNKSMRPRLKGFLQRACGGKVACVNVAFCRSDLRPACIEGRCALTDPGTAPPQAVRQTGERE